MIEVLRPPVESTQHLYTRDISWHGFAISNASTSDLASAAVTINQMLQADKLHTRIGAHWTLTDAAEAHQAMADGRVKARIVVTP